MSALRLDAAWQLSVTSRRGHPGARELDVERLRDAIDIRNGRLPAFQSSSHRSTNP